MAPVQNNTVNQHPLDAKVKPNSPAADMQNTFIKLMTAQIQNQDPTKPVDSSEFLNQFASMSQVQSLENMSALTKNNMVLLENLQYLNASGLVGQTVKVRAEELDLNDQPVQAEIELTHSANELVATLTDANGIKTTVPLPASEPGRVSFEIDPVALGLKPGKYDIEVKSGSDERYVVEVKGKVSNVRLGSDGPVLDVAGVGSVPFYKITEFSEASLFANLMIPPATSSPQRPLSQFTQGQRHEF
ncbi:flagellar hook capping FlgD N-terminal domain-containing protein [Pseudomonas chlororaphis subsp. aurantiaca]|uniref:flagellar hook capping FlgD N-terminal domain-containing protein n=1 Tax=Pseudomonas chlororaphis TaxID=587753 RepID=UPI0027DE0728|nr:flagellar hook capping FlgD N-terminal domain-containing protein [Pseudomonas chlororaphis]WMI97596.1 flagellar hook capping FlgD N-terminal domain-containing protein [Pseudomonas chlororaphis subsp. aurantiaca]